MIKINMCCGKRNFGQDWIHIDGADLPHIKYRNITSLPQFLDNSVDLIYCSHGIAYFDRQEIIPILNEWKRVLKPGGILRLATPCFETMVGLYVNIDCSLEDIIGPLYGKMKMGEEAIYHKTTYDYDSLESLLESLGFNGVIPYDWRKTEHAEFDDHSQAYLPKMDKENGTLISLNVECTK